MTAVLARLLGRGRLEVAEDIVQETLTAALTHWRSQPIPNDPAAWLYTVARRRALDWLRQQQRRQTYATDFAEHEAIAPEADPPPLIAAQLDHVAAAVGDRLYASAFTPEALADSQLRMMFACCHERFPQVTQVALILKLLCGFTASEIARAFLVEEEAMSKRLQRARSELSALAPYIQEGFGDDHIRKHHPTVAAAVLLLFNEGYSASSGERVIRHDLCREAIRLALLLAGHLSTAGSEADALVALMCLQAARFESRLDDAGDIVLLPEQDRTRWNQPLIAQGLAHLQRAMAAADMPGPRLLQAGIAAQHAVAPSYARTDWPMLEGLFDALIQLDPSPIVQLHRAVALAESQGPAAGLAALEPIAAALEQHHLYLSTRAELLARLGHIDQARDAYDLAARAAPTEPERRLIQRKRAAIG